MQVFNQTINPTSLVDLDETSLNQDELELYHRHPEVGVLFNFTPFLLRKKLVSAQSGSELILSGFCIKYLPHDKNRNSQISKHDEPIQNSALG